MAKGKCFLAERSKPFFILVLAALFIVASASFAFSQTNRYESIKGVKFKDGTVLMGTVTQLNVETLTIRLENGQTVVRKFDDVDTFIKRDDAVTTVQDTKPAVPPAAAAAPAVVPATVPSAAPPTTAPAAAPAAVVADRLRVFCAIGVLQAAAHPVRSDWSEYHLTPKGLAFYPVVATAIDWAESTYMSSEGPALVQTHTTCGADFVPSLVCDQCAQQLTAGSIEIVPHRDTDALNA